MKKLHSCMISITCASGKKTNYGKSKETSAFFRFRGNEVNNWGIEFLRQKIYIWYSIIENPKW